MLLRTLATVWPACWRMCPGMVLKSRIPPEYQCFWRPSGIGVGDVAIEGMVLSFDVAVEVSFVTVAPNDSPGRSKFLPRWASRSAADMMGGTLLAMKPV